MQNFFQSLKDNKVVQIIASVLVVVLLVVLIVAGFGFFITLFTIIILGIAIYFGALRELAGSIIVVFLTKTLMAEIKEVLNIWMDYPKLDQFFAFVESTGYIKLILVFFLFIFVIGFVTGSIKLFNITAKNEVKLKKDDE